MTTRRAFLKAGGAVAAAALAPLPAPAAEPALVTGEMAATTVASPYVEYPWQWWVSPEGTDTFDRWFNTREEALEEAKGFGSGATIAECMQQDFSLQVSGGEVLELLHMNNEELIGEGEFFDSTAEQDRELGDAVTAVIEAWAAKHKLKLTAWTFGATRNHTTIEAA